MMTRRNTRGMTLIEMLVALVVFSIVMSVALGFLRAQSRGFTRGTEEMDVLQNVSYASTTLSQQIRTAGADVPDNQPTIVYAGADVLAFNADYATNVANDPFAVYYDPDAPTGAVTAMQKAQAEPIPLTAFNYPAVDYAQGPSNSPAELIVFYFEPDSSTARTDDYVLMRQVNAQPAQEIAHNLLQTGGAPFFRYYRRVTTPAGVASVDTMPTAALPLSHSVPVHLSPADTGVAARIDSIVGVVVTLTATNGRTGSAERTRNVQTMVDIPNALMATRKTCGDPPIFASALSAVSDTLAGGAPVIDLTWSAAVDETGGEKDVVRYVMYRRKTSESTWGDPYLSIPAGNSSYAYSDAAVLPDTSYIYAVAAQDCTPSLSALSVSTTVTAP
ncbi:MAG TPA: type II secretion system protein [Gemmatimonadales bacterium]|nr:type II secretion system protein [Gemmatimonadales bacterium]